MISSTVKRRTNAKVRKPSDVPISAFSSTLTEKPKRGRRTIPDSHLLGARDQWTSLLEESWPDIGWPLLQIRERPTSTIDDVRKAFQPVKGKPHNSGLAESFYRETIETATPAEVLRNRIRCGDLQGQIIQFRGKLTEIEWSVTEIEAALKVATPEYASKVEQEVIKRRQNRIQLQNDIQRLTAEERALDKKSQDQAAFVYAWELLDFLRRVDRYGIKPISIANALAGLPRMRWRQSYARCSQMPPQEARFQYRVLNVVLKLWKRRPTDSKESLTLFFKSQLPKLPKKLGYTRDFLLQNWHDLKSAIEVCLSTEQNEGEVPYILTSIFLKAATSQKNPIEKMLADQEKLEPRK